MTLPAFSQPGAGHETSVAWGAHAAGHFGLLLVNVATENVPTPADWLAAPLSGIAGNGVRLFAFYRFATSGAEPAVSIPGVAVNYAWGAIMTFTGVHPTSPFHRAAAIGTPAGSTSGVAPALVTGIADTLIVNALAYNADNAAAGIVTAASEANSSLGALTKRYDAGTITGNGGGLVVFTGTKAAGGEVLQTTMTVVSTTLAGITFALRAADVEDGITPRRIGSPRVRRAA
jgi:hypothetical protein